LAGVTFSVSCNSHGRQQAPFPGLDPAAQYFISAVDGIATSAQNSAVTSLIGLLLACSAGAPGFTGKAAKLSGRRRVPVGVISLHGSLAACDRTALATLYCALVSDLMLTRMGATGGDLIVEGTFSSNLAFCQTLGALRPKQRVFAAEDAAGTARGAAMLAHWPPAYRVAEPTPVPATSIAGLDAYRDTWTAAINLIAR
jgi:hypothetical protein